MSQYDPIGQAVYNYHFKKIRKPIVIHSDDFDSDEVDPSYFFRSFDKMPQLEKEALKLAKGKILDIGACAGCHSIHLQNNGLDVTALEKSSLCCEVLKDRGMESVINADLFDLKNEKFDTLLLLMNGTGIAGKLDNLPNFLSHLKNILAPDGQILIDSSDLIYLYLDDDGSAMVDINSPSYYGELMYQTEYMGKKGVPFPWLYLDHETLTFWVKRSALKVESIVKGDHYDYLAIIKHA